MRDRAPIRHVDYFWWTLGAVIGGFIIQSILQVWFGAGRFLFDWVALSPDNILSFKVWTIFSYGLMHGSLGHLFFNCLTLIFIGRWLSRQIEPRQFLQLTLAALFMGGLAWLLLHALVGGPALAKQPLVGFSAAVMGMITVACLMMPGKLTLLIFFVLPAEINPRVLLKLLMGFEVLGLLFLELPPLVGRQPLIASPIASSAHLGGALAGYLFYRMLQRGGIPSLTKVTEKFSQKVSVEDPSWAKKRTPASSGKFKVNLTNRKDLRKEVDRILDKINKEGFQSLSPEEQKILDEAGDLLKK